MQKRKDRRFKQWNKTTIRAMAGGQDPAGASEIDAFTYDLSLGGARVHSKERFEVGTLLQLRIELVRSRETINLQGRVRWLRHDETEKVYEMGVEFDHATPRTFMSLMKNLHDGRVTPASPEPSRTAPGRTGIS